jgi:hypothetical protein
MKKDTIGENLKKVKMIVICKRPTKRLVKGVRYETGSLYNSGSNQRWQEGTVEILGIGRFSVDNFTDTNGNPLPKTDIIVQPTSIEQLTFEQLSKGDILVCTSDNYKTLGKGCMYQIEELKSISSQRMRWNKQTYTHVEKTIKFVGIPRTLKFSNWRFRKLSAQEAREISLNSVLHDEEPSIVKSKDIRKIELVANKDAELMGMISKSIIDPNRHHLSIIDWACQKSGANLGINPSDYDTLLNMSLKDILEKIETK